MSPSCSHSSGLATAPSPHAQAADFAPAPPAKRLAATTSSGRAPKSTAGSTPPPPPPATTFPAPLVLPGDDLALDPSCPPQSFRSWKGDKDRNPVTPERSIIYVASPPEISAGLQARMEGWTKVRAGGEGSVIPPPKTADVCEYLEAFYAGLQVKLLLPATFQFSPWDDDDDPSPAAGPKSAPSKAKAKSKPSSPSYIGLTIPTTSIRIRARKTPSSSSPYSHQLNLNDLLDGAIEALPHDAYALLLLVEHDLYEDDDDEFCCGRAYGGSRVAVVSSARYQPALDAIHGVEREHGWPASHCAAYVERMCSTTSEGKGKNTKKKRKLAPPTENDDAAANSPLAAALEAYLTHSSSSSPPTPHQLKLLFLSRLARTASHELGHCLGVDHCTYYACIMQGSASLPEDARQPPYLCPVDLAKLEAVTGRGERERCESLRGVCARWEEGAVWAAFRAWLDRRIGELGGGAK